MIANVCRSLAELNSSIEAGPVSPRLFIRSSGSNTKSNPSPDFWSPYNEEPLDENHHFGAKYSFLFAHPSPRVRGLRLEAVSATTNASRNIPVERAFAAKLPESSKRRHLNIFFPSFVLLCDFACGWLKSFSIFNDQSSILAVIFPS
jgi:hypothetical protein